MAGIDDVLERLVGDEAFRKALASNPAEALSGYQLTRADLELLATQFDDAPDAERAVEQRTSKSAMMSLLSSLDGLIGGGGGGGGGTTDDGHKDWIDLLSVSQGHHEPGNAADETPIAASRFGISMDGVEVGGAADTGGTMAEDDWETPAGVAGGNLGSSGQDGVAADNLGSSGQDGVRAGGVETQDIGFTKEIDKSSPQLAKEIDKSSPQLAREIDKSSPKLQESIASPEPDPETAAGYLKIGDIKGESTDSAAADGYIKIGDIQGESSRAGDVTGDGTPDIITGAGPGGGSRASSDYYLKIDTIEGESEGLLPHIEQGNLATPDQDPDAAADMFIKIQGVDGESENAAPDVYVKIDDIKGETRGSSHEAAHVVQQGQGQKQADETYLKVELEDVQVTSHQLGGSSGDALPTEEIAMSAGGGTGGDPVPTEEVSFNYAKIQVEYDETADGTGLPNREASADDFFDVEDA